MSGDKIERTCIGDFKGFEIYFDPAYNKEDQDRVQVEFPQGRRNFKNVNGARAAINTALRKAKKRERPRIRLCWVQHVGYSSFSRFAGRYEVRHGYFTGHDAKNGKPMFVDMEGKEVSRATVKGLYPYVPGYTESVIAEIAAQRTAVQLAQRSLDRLEEKRPYMIRDGRAMNDRSVKLRGMSSSGGRVGTIGAIELDDEAVLLLREWQEFYEKNAQEKR